MRSRIRTLVTSTSAALTLGLIAWAGVLAGAAYADSFPRSIYPLPIAAKAEGALALCPSSRGLDQFDSSSRQSSERVVAAYGRTNLGEDIVRSDRAWWPQVRRMWASSHRRGSREVVLRAGPAAASPYAVIVSHSCGGALVRASLAVTVGRPHSSCMACKTTFFLIARDSRPLIYYTH
jgi:hypothetical protein